MKALSTVIYTQGWYTDPSTGEQLYFDGSLWYTLSDGSLTPLDIVKQPAPRVCYIAPGETLRLSYSYYYAGPAAQVTEYASIGVYGTITHVYDEKVSSSKSRQLPLSVPAVKYSGYIDLVIPVTVHDDWNTIEVKVYDGGKELGVRYYQALSILGSKPIFTNFSIVGATAQSAIVLKPKDTLRVAVEFDYMVGQSIQVQLYSAVIMPAATDISSTKSINLAATSAPVRISETIDIVMPESGGITSARNGIYDLYADITDYDDQAKSTLPSAVELQGFTSTLDMLGSIIPIMVMLMLMQVMGSFTGEER